MTKLQAGDIVVFKAGNDWIGKAIAWLTKSDVSHAAMMLEDGRMVEMGASGIYAGPVEIREGENAIPLRLDPARDAAPLIAAAQTYLNAAARYDFPALGLLAGLIIYRQLRPTPKRVAILDLILRAACVALDKLLAKMLRHPGKTMVCSQLVYQVYEDCGKDYHIELDNGLLQAMDAADAGSVCLADLAADAPELDLFTATNDTFPDEEDLARELLLAMEEETDMVAGSVDLGALPSWAKRFLDKIEEFLEKSQGNLPLDALFVTPADLAYKAKNLTALEKVDVVRDKA